MFEPGGEGGEGKAFSETETAKTADEAKTKQEIEAMATSGVLDKARKKIQELKDTLADKERELAEQERAFAEKRRAELGALIDRAGGIDLADELIAGVIAEARSIHERALDKQQEAVARVQEWRQRGKQFCRPAKKRNPKNPGQAAPDASPNQAHL